MLEQFFGVMNMLPPTTKNTFHEHLPAIHDAYVAASHGSMEKAFDEEHGDTPTNDTYDIDVSVDGTWQRRDYSSLNGVVTIISADTGKCVDRSCEQNMQRLPVLER